MRKDVQIGNGMDSARIHFGLRAPGANIVQKLADFVMHSRHFYFFIYIFSFMDLFMNTNIYE
jgi:hypothetical protein